MEAAWPIPPEKDQLLQLFPNPVLLLQFEGASSITIAIYWPGVLAVTSSFYTEASLLFDLFATYSLSVIITGDVDIHFEKPDDSDIMKLMQILDVFSFEQFIKSPTHDLGGVLNVVIARTRHLSNDIAVTEVGLLDHMLVT